MSLNKTLGADGWTVDPIDLPPAHFTTDANSNVTGLVGPDGVVFPLFAGRIMIAAPAVSGVPQTITSQAITASMSGEKLTFETLVHDDFGIMTTTNDILNAPGHILVPPGVRYGRITLSVAFPAEAASAANGIRWARALQGAGTHKGNTGARPAVANAGNVVAFSTAIVPVAEGEYYWGSAIQNCGSSLTLSPGNASNNYASSWMQMEFFK